MMKIRYIFPDDDRMEISRIYEESWRYAYKGIVPQPYLDRIPRGFWAPRIDAPGRNTLLAVENRKIVGTSSFCKSRTAQFENWGEVISVYILPEYMGKGYGKALLKAAISELNKLGYTNIFLWVLENNIRARHFYEHIGFVQTDDSSIDTIGGKALREIRYIYTE